MRKSKGRPVGVALSPRQRQTLALLFDGLADKEIAGRLGISAYTVNQYIKAIYASFGVHSRASLLARQLQARRRSRRSASTP